MLLFTVLTEKGPESYAVQFTVCEYTFVFFVFDCLVVVFYPKSNIDSSTCKLFPAFSTTRLYTM